ncbi:hypothetical protein P43SY_008652 [Pythium insidiosum]|uniref:Uncharacterized protein n=1 Tax=Pythium insidiosum TaxID=114742 RepID=A0AAD5LDX7_PYTIN|nr:hypothetical protein P43SY_008652 [Pythium insidiosum]
MTPAPPMAMMTVTVNGVTRRADADPHISRQRGIIISIHELIMPLGVSLIRELRCLGNDELIQVYHCLPQELSRASQQLLLSIDDRLEIVDVCTEMLRRQSLQESVVSQFKSYWIKPLAVYHTDITEVLLLDADDVLLANPSVVRMTQGYRETGALFFYDRVLNCGLFFNQPKRGRSYLQRLIDDFNYTSFGLPGPRPSAQVLASFAYRRRTCHEQDSSMVLIDKARAGKALDVLWWLITQERRAHQFSWGDKESFWLAFELAQRNYSFSPWGVSVVSSSPNRDMDVHNDTLCGSIAQFFPAEDPIPQLLYVNGRALLDPLPGGYGKVAPNLQYNDRPTHVTPHHDDHNDSHIEVAPEEEEMLQDDEEEPLYNYDQARKRFCRRQTPFDDFDIDDEEDDTTTKLEVEVAQLRDTVDIMERQVAWAVERMTALQGLVDLYENERRRSFVES